MDAEEKPLLTYCLVTYNQEKYVRESVLSAFAQTYLPLEIVLSDDCSTDRTFEIMRELAAGYREPHRIVRIARLRRRVSDNYIVSQFCSAFCFCPSCRLHLVIEALNSPRYWRIAAARIWKRFRR